MSLNVLLMCNKPKVGNEANTVIDHIEAIENYSNHQIWLLSNLGVLGKRFDFNKFDVVIIHYSLCILYNYYISLDVKKRLRAYQGLKVIFIQDEYRQINHMIEQLQFLDVDVLFTCFSEQEKNKIYTPKDLPKVSKYNNLTGYIPNRLLEVSNHPKTAARPVHVGYRGRRLPYWYGELGYEKWNIVKKWRQHVKDKTIKTNISYHEHDRIYGPKWFDFISSCKAMLGVESGASVMDFSGELEKSIDYFQLTHPQASFHEVHDLFLQDHEGKYKLNQISPRCFEAIALKTVLVLYEGEYSGILSPDRHYIVLKKNFSNIEAVIAKLKDDKYLQTMADCAYEEVALNSSYSYQSFVSYVDKTIEKEFKARTKTKVEFAYTIEDFKKDEKCLSIKTKLYKMGMKVFQKLPLIMRMLIKSVLTPRQTAKYFSQKIWYKYFVNKV